MAGVPAAILGHEVNVRMEASSGNVAQQGRKWVLEDVRPPASPGQPGLESCETEVHFSLVEGFVILRFYICSSN